MGWNAMTYDSRSTVLRVGAIRPKLFTLAEVPETWKAKTACPEWEVRDIVGHIIDTTETYFEGFDAARGHTEGDPAYGLAEMAKHAEGRASRSETLPKRR